MTEFQQILHHGLTRAGDPHGARAALANALGVTRARINDALAGRGGYAMSVKACLRLAVLNEDDPLRVLRAAGKTEEADLLAQIFGTPGRDRLTATQRTQLALLADLSDADRTLVLGLMRSLTKKSSR